MAVAEPPARFEQVRDKAAGLVDAPSRLQRLLGQASRKLATLSHGRFGELARQLSLALEMVRAHLAGEYTELSKPTLVSLIAALLYFVMPFDAVPDFLFGWGFMDDAAVLAYVVQALREEIAAFERWQRGRLSPPKEVEDEL